MTRRGVTVPVRLPEAPARYDQSQEAQFRRAVEDALLKVNAEIASEPAFLDISTELDSDGDLNLSYKLNEPFAVSVGYAWSTTAQPTRAEVVDGTHANYAEIDSSEEDAYEITAAVATASGDEVYLTVVPFSQLSAEGRAGEEYKTHIVLQEIQQGQIGAGTIAAEKLTDQARKWSTDIVFSTSDYRTVNWTSGDITLANGDTFNIVSGTTGSMAAITYVYLDRTVSTTVLQTTTTFGNVADDDVILVAVAKPASDNSQRAFFVPGVGIFGLNEENIGENSITAATIKAGTITAAEIAAATITAGNIAAGAITAAKISVLTLSAINVDAGTLTSGILQNVAGTRYIDLDATGTDPFIEHDNFTLLADGTATFSGDLSAAGGTFSGSLSAASGTFAGDLKAAQVDIQDAGGTVRMEITAATNAVFNATGTGFSFTVAGNTALSLGSNELSFFNTSSKPKQTVTGSRGGNAALQSLLSKLSIIGLITDSSTT